MRNEAHTKLMAYTLIGASDKNDSLCSMYVVIVRELCNAAVAAANGESLTMLRGNVVAGRLAAAVAKLDTQCTQLNV